MDELQDEFLMIKKRNKWSKRRSDACRVGQSLNLGEEDNEIQVGTPKDPNLRRNRTRKDLNLKGSLESVKPKILKDLNINVKECQERF